MTDIIARGSMSKERERDEKNFRRMALEEENNCMRIRSSSDLQEDMSLTSYQQQKHRLVAGRLKKVLCTACI